MEMKKIKLLGLVFSLLATFAATSAKADQVFDWTSESAGYYMYSPVGAYDDGVVTGLEMKKSVYRTYNSIVSGPASPLPAMLPNYYAEVRYVVANGQIALILSAAGIVSNGNGDSLSFTTVTTSSTANSWETYSTYTGGTGVYAGAQGYATSSGVLLGWNSQQYYYEQTWTSVSHLEIPSAVPEPETYAMLLAGLGLMGGVARRRQRRAN